jgi:hypothetical protein
MAPEVPAKKAKVRSRREGVLMVKAGRKLRKSRGVEIQA